MHFPLLSLVSSSSFPQNQGPPPRVESDECRCFQKHRRIVAATAVRRASRLSTHFPSQHLLYTRWYESTFVAPTWHGHRWAAVAVCSTGAHLCPLQQHFLVFARNIMILLCCSLRVFTCAAEQACVWHSEEGVCCCLEGLATLLPSSYCIDSTFQLRSIRDLVCTAPNNARRRRRMLYLRQPLPPYLKADRRRWPLGRLTSRLRRSRTPFGET